MKRFSAFLVIAILFALLSCKEKDRFAEPAYILKKWSNAIREMNHKDYSRCEAYPKSEPVFKEMYREYYIVDLMVIDAEEPDEKDIRKDTEGNRYIHRLVSFEGSIVSRKNNKPYQILRGDAVFIRFIEDKRAADGWLISNRTMIRIPR